MRRLTLLTCCLSLLAAAPAAHAQRPPLSATLSACRTGADPAARTAVFAGSMPAVRGTHRMWMRFDLLQRRPPSATFGPLRGIPTFGVWEKSQPRRSGFIYRKQVGELLAPAAYRAVVRFRWYDRRGMLLRATRRTTAICRQPDPRPDLLAGTTFRAERGPQPGTAVYQLTVRNEGRGAAGAFDVVLAAGGVERPVVRVGGLPAGGREVVEIAGPRCEPGSTVRFTLDAAGEVEESDEAGNVVDRPCPFTAPAARAARAPG